MAIPKCTYGMNCHSALPNSHHSYDTVQTVRSVKKYKFNTLDGFTQIALTDESSRLNTMHTPWGRYWWLHLLYGISSAPEEFQLQMHEALQDVYCVADDILVVGQGETRDEANRQVDLNVFALMKRVHERNLKFNPQKIQFKLPTSQQDNMAVDRSFRLSANFCFSLYLRGF